MAPVRGGPERPVSPACSPRSGEGRECVCKVCTCGFHRCPQKHTSVHTKFGNKTISEYSAKYPKWPMPAKFTRKVPPPEHSNARIATTTTYTNDYVKHPYTPTTSCRPSPKTENTDRFQNETTYNVDYWDKSGQMQPRVKAPQAKHEMGKKFEGESVYSLEFRNHGPQPRNIIAKHNGNLGNQGAKFDGDSTYHDDYRPWQMPAKYVHKKPDNSQPTGKIQGPTTYQADYVDRQVPGKCPVLSRGKPSVVCGDHMCY